jgi:transcriptional regulator with XRE-family HTH domain
VSGIPDVRNTRKATGDPVLGAWLREYRQKDGRALKEVAHACDVSVSALSEYERGKKLPSRRVLSRLARHYGVRVDHLVRHWGDDAA